MNGTFSFKYEIPHCYDCSALVNNFLSKFCSYYSSIVGNYPMNLAFSIQRSLKESSFGITVPPSHAA